MNMKSIDDSYTAEASENRENTRCLQLTSRIHELERRSRRHIQPGFAKECSYSGPNSNKLLTFNTSKSYSGYHNPILRIIIQNPSLPSTLRIDQIILAPSRAAPSSSDHISRIVDFDALSSRRRYSRYAAAIATAIAYTLVAPGIARMAGASRVSRAAVDAYRSRRIVRVALLVAPLGWQCARRCQHGRMRNSAVYIDLHKAHCCTDGLSDPCDNPRLALRLSLPIDNDCADR